MATYKIGDLILVDPTITVDGAVIRMVFDGVPQNFTLADVRLTCPVFDDIFPVEHASTPTDWGMDALNIWVLDQLSQYIVE